MHPSAQTTKVCITISLIISMMAGVGIGFPDDLRAETKSVQIKHNALTLNGKLITHDRELRGSRIVLMLHGTLAHHGMEIMTGLQAALNERGMATLAISLSLGQDNRSGMYDCGIPHIHKHEDALDEIDAWIDWLENQGIKEITLLGHSRGGNQIAWYAAERMRSSVTRVILMAPMISESDGSANYKKNYGTSLQDVMDKASAAGSKMMNDVDFIYCSKTKVRGSSFLSYYKKEPRRDTPGLMGKIKRPVLVLIAENDQVVPKLPERMNQLGPLENIKTITISESGHMFLDFALEDSADAIAEFLQ